ncbi:hypothetical protein cyc_08631 [Cyclospora cayetanensis]|uniref:Uncharacterized protein n=1 Tax=Cyclospora cayetanensis TaxID=88456 RepID=A0A1D3DAY3_9EIME|nr:hypothetical protein cyc_08631 [Cyclospora cayetanensis]
MARLFGVEGRVPRVDTAAALTTGIFPLVQQRYSSTKASGGRLDDPKDQYRQQAQHEHRTFAAQADAWWDVNGPAAVLHAYTPIRVSMVVQQLQTLPLYQRILRQKQQQTRHSDDHLQEELPLLGVRIADVGCGAGLLSEALATAGATVVGVDANDRMLAAASRRQQQRAFMLQPPRKRNGSSCAPAVGRPFPFFTQLLRAAAEWHPRRSECGQYHAVVLSEVIEHIWGEEQRRKAVAAAAARLQPGGLLLITTPNRTLENYVASILLAEHILRIVAKVQRRKGTQSTPLLLEADPRLDCLDSQQAPRQVCTQVHVYTRNAQLGELHHPLRATVPLRARTSPVLPATAVERTRRACGLSEALRAMNSNKINHPPTFGAARQQTAAVPAQAKDRQRMLCKDACTIEAHPLEELRVTVERQYLDEGALARIPSDRSSWEADVMSLLPAPVAVDTPDDAAWQQRSKGLPVGTHAAREFNTTLPAEARDAAKYVPLAPVATILRGSITPQGSDLRGSNRDENFVAARSLHSCPDAKSTGLHEYLWRADGTIAKLSIANSATLSTYSLPNGVSVHPSCGCVFATDGAVAAGAAPKEPPTAGATLDEKSAADVAFVLAGGLPNEIVAVKQRSSSRSSTNAAASLPTASTAAFKVSARAQVGDRLALLLPVQHGKAAVLAISWTYAKRDSSSNNGARSGKQLSLLCSVLDPCTLETFSSGHLFLPAAAALATAADSLQLEAAVLQEGLPEEAVGGAARCTRVLLVAASEEVGAFYSFVDVQEAAAQSSSDSEDEAEGSASSKGWQLLPMHGDALQQLNMGSHKPRLISCSPSAAPGQPSLLVECVEGELLLFRAEKSAKGHMRCVKRSRRILPLSPAAAAAAGGAVLLPFACCLEWTAAAAPETETATKTGAEKGSVSCCRFLLRDLRWLSPFGPTYSVQLATPAVFSVRSLLRCGQQQLLQALPLLWDCEGKSFVTRCPLATPSAASAVGSYTVAGLLPLRAGVALQQLQQQLPEPLTEPQQRLAERLLQLPRHLISGEALERDFAAFVETPRARQHAGIVAASAASAKDAAANAAFMDAGCNCPSALHAAIASNLLSPSWASLYPSVEQQEAKELQKVHGLLRLLQQQINLLQQQYSRQEELKIEGKIVAALTSRLTPQELREKASREALFQICNLRL